MSRLVSVVLVVLTASVFAAPVPVVKKNQWVIELRSQLYLFTEGDEKPVKLTQGEDIQTHPDWSPDGKRIAFCTSVKGHAQICTMDADGKNVTQLTHGEQSHYAPNWSPDGQTVAFYRSVGDDHVCQICTINAKDGSDLEILSNENDYNPVYSPNGKSIAFVTDRREGYELYILDANGKNATRLVNQPVFSIAVSPAWSPDGKQIAFSLLLGKGYELQTIEPDGRGLTPLTRFGDHKKARSPSWSPNGKRLSFLLEDYTDGTENPCSLWVMDANGENQKELLRLGEDASLLSTKAMWRPR